jgi:hypothetical protein
MTLKKMIDGVEVECNPEEEAAIRAEWAANEAKQQATAYIENRRIEYPSIGDQLDDLFHKGYFSDNMAAKIQAVKDKYPKS